MEFEQQFQLSPGEALYGLGQHQEGFFNLRDIPVRLLQANTNIAIPFLAINKGIRPALEQRRAYGFQSDD